MLEIQNYNHVLFKSSIVKLHFHENFSASRTLKETDFPEWFSKTMFANIFPQFLTKLAYRKSRLT